MFLIFGQRSIHKVNKRLQNSLQKVVRGSVCRSEIQIDSSHLTYYLCGNLERKLRMNYAPGLMHMETRDWRMHNGIRASWHENYFLILLKNFSIKRQFFSRPSNAILSSLINIYVNVADDCAWLWWPGKSSQVCITQVNCSKNGESCPIRQLC